MTSDTARDHYEHAYDRLETELVEIPGGGPTASSKPAVLVFPDDADLTAQAINDAISNDEYVPVAPFIDDKEDGSFYYAASKVYRPEADPDLSVRADAHALRVFENPHDEEEPLSELTFEEFKAFVTHLEDRLDLTFLPYEEDDENEDAE